MSQNYICEKCYKPLPTRENQFYDFKSDGGNYICSSRNVGPAKYVNLSNTNFDDILNDESCIFPMQLYFGDSYYDLNAAFNPQLRKDFIDFKSLPKEDLFYYKVRHHFVQLVWDGEDGALNQDVDLFLTQRGVQTLWDGEIMLTVPVKQYVKVPEWNGIWNNPDPQFQFRTEIKCWVGGGVSILTDSYEDDNGSAVDTTSQVTAWGGFIVGIGLALAEATAGISILIAVAFQVVSIALTMIHNENDYNNPIATTLSIGACQRIKSLPYDNDPRKYYFYRKTGAQMRDTGLCTGHLVPGNTCHKVNIIERDSSDRWGARMKTHNYITVRGPFNYADKEIPEDEFKSMVERIHRDHADPEKLAKYKI
jgi:hypothetical protein